MRYWKDVILGLILMLLVPVLLALFCGAIIGLGARRLYWWGQQRTLGSAPAISDQGATR
jgi:hypothetical protein